MNQLTVQAGLTLTQATQLQNWLPPAVTLSQNGSRFGSWGQIIPTSGVTALGPLPQGTLGYLMVSNLDTNTGNIIYLYSSTGGKSFGQVRPGGFALLELGPDAQAPAAQALSTAAYIQCLVIEL